MTSATRAIPNHWIIGFSGHRRVEREAEVRAVMERELQALQKEGRGTLGAISSLACGGDTLFAQAATGLGLPWRVLLPMPHALFFNDNDFTPAQRTEAMRLLPSAGHVEVVCEPKDDAEGHAEAWRNDAFFETGVQTVDESDVLVAVLRTGTSAAGKGGTAEIVSYALRLGRPVLLIDPDTLAVERKNWGDVLKDGLMETLATLPEPSGSNADLPPGAGTALTEMWSVYRRASNTADSRTPRMRWMTSWAVRLHTYATCLGAVVLAFSAIHDPDHSALHLSLALIKLLLVLGGLSLVVWFFYRQPQAVAAQARLVTEICRSLVSVWPFPQLAQSIYHSPLKAVQHFLRWAVERVEARRDPSTADGRVLSFQDLKKGYLDGRVRDQLHHYRKQKRKAQEVGPSRERLAVFFSALAAVATAWLLVMAWEEYRGGSGHEAHGSLLKEVLGCSMIVLPALASLCVSLVSINEWKRRVERYEEMIEFLEEMEVRVEHACRQEVLERLVLETEHALLGENFEWYHLATKSAQT